MTITSTVTTQSARHLLAVGVQLTYNIQSSSSFYLIGNALNNAISSGAFGNMLRRKTGIAVIASADAMVVDISPTNMPTQLPAFITETGRGIKLGTTPIILIAVLGFFGILGTVGLTYYCSTRKRQRIYLQPEP